MDLVNGNAVTLNDYKRPFFRPKGQRAEHTYSIWVSFTDAKVANPLAHGIRIGPQRQGMWHVPYLQARLVLLSQALRR